MAKKTRIAINGFGRIGRLILRAAIESGRKDLEFVAINDVMPVSQSAFLLEYDSVHGKCQSNVEAGGGVIKAGGHKIIALSESDPLNLPWRELDIDIVMECTGVFSDAEKATVHLDRGAKRVLVSAPSDGADATIVYGVNEKTLKKEHKIISCGSCTTNALAPIAAVLDAEFGISSGWATTVHAYTGDQRLVDANHKDLRRARAAGVSIIPTGTGAAKAIGLVLPNLAGKLDGTALRVPTPDVSVVELVANLEKPASADAINKAMKVASGKMAGVLGYNELPLVSVDFTHDARSAIFDAGMTKTVGDKIAHIAAWYDNEWGFPAACLTLRR